MVNDRQDRRLQLELALAERVRPFLQPSIERESHDTVIDLVRPTGHRPLPASVRDAVVAALEAGETHYTARTGIAALRQAIAARSTAEGFPATAETCVVTNGGSEALFIALQALVPANRRVVLVDPVAPHVAALAAFIGGEVEQVPALPLSVPDGAGLVVLPAASGIDGGMTGDGPLAELLQSAAEAGATVVLDRSSVPDCYDPPEPFSRPDLAAEIITIGSFSGAFGLAGWRAGYFTAPERLMPGLASLKESMSISTTTPTQFAMLAALDDADTILATARESARARRDIATGLLEAAGIPFRRPDVYPGLLIDVRQAALSDAEVARRLAEERSVRVEAGSTYGVSLAGFIRIDLNADDEQLRSGIEQIAAFLTKEAR